MNFTDIVALAKAGYSPKDVKELLELCETDPKTKEVETPNTEVKEGDGNQPKEPELNAFEKLVKDNIEKE